MQTFSEPLYPAGTQPTDTFSQSFYDYAGGTAGADLYIDIGVTHMAFGDGVEKQITWSFNDEFYSAEVYQDVIDSDFSTSISEELLETVIPQEDSGSVSESESVVVELVSEDTAEFLEDTPQIQFTAEADSGSAEENQSAFREFAYFNDVDNAFGLEEEALSVEISDPDEFTMVETQTDLLTPDQIDNIIYTEDAEVSVSLTENDSAIADEDSALDILEEDYAFAAESEFLEVLNQSSDDAECVDNQILQALISQSDEVSADDEESLPEVFITQEEYLQYEEQSTISAETSSEDNLSYSETEILGKFSEDFATSSDDEELLASILESDTFDSIEEEMLLLLGQLSAETDPYYPAVLKSRPLHYWRFGALTGNILPDKMRKNDGVYYGTIDSTRGIVAGKNAAIYFDGTESVRFGDVELPSRISFEFWIEDAQGVVIQKQEEFKAEITGNIMTFEVYDLAGDVVFLHQVDITGKRYIVWNISEEMSQVYVDAELHSEILAIGTVRPNTANTLSAATDFIAANNFTGVVDELAIYERILLPEEITAHWNAGNKYQSYETAAVGYNSMIYVPGYEKADFNHEYTVLNETASLITGPQKESPGALDGLIEFEGSSELLTTTLNTASIGFWFRSDAVGSKTPVIKSGLGDEFSLKIDASDALVVNAGGESRVHSALPSLSDGLWHHIIVSLGSNGNAIYHNGVLVDSSATLGEFSTPDGSIILNAENNSAIADFFFTWREITAPEAKQLYDISYYGRHDLSVNDQTPPSISEGQTDIYVFDKQLAGT